VTLTEYLLLGAAAVFVVGFVAVLVCKLWMTPAEYARKKAAASLRADRRRDATRLEPGLECPRACFNETKIHNEVAFVAKRAFCTAGLSVR
jgi:hypothetical protein